MSSRLLIASLAAGLLAGCNTIDPVSLSVDPGFGEAVKYNVAVQTIDPAPVYGELDAQPGESGARGAEAIERYRTGQVREVEQIQTTTSQGGGGGPQ